MTRAKRIISKALILIMFIQVIGVNGRGVLADILEEIEIKEEEKGYFEENAGEGNTVDGEDETETEEISEKFTGEMTEDEENDEGEGKNERIYEREEEDFWARVIIILSKDGRGIRSRLSLG